MLPVYVSPSMLHLVHKSDYLFLSYYWLSYFSEEYKGYTIAFDAFNMMIALNPCRLKNIRLLLIIFIT